MRLLKHAVMEMLSAVHCSDSMTAQATTRQKVASMRCTACLISPLRSILYTAERLASEPATLLRTLLLSSLDGKLHIRQLDKMVLAAIHLLEHQVVCLDIKMNNEFTLD